MYNVDEWSNILYKFCGNLLIIRRNAFIFPFSNILSWKIWNNMNMKVYYQVSICFFKLSNNNNRKKSSLIYNMSARHERHECDTSATQTTRVLHEWKVLILITTRVKTYFHTLKFTIWQVKDYKESNNFIPFGNVSFPCQNASKKCTTETKLFNGKSYIKKLYTRL